MATKRKTTTPIQNTDKPKKTRKEIIWKMY